MKQVHFLISIISIIGIVFVAIGYENSISLLDFLSNSLMLIFVLALLIWLIAGVENNDDDQEQS